MKERSPTSQWRAYFSMEIGLEPGMPTYSGGLDVLAGDTVRSAADLKASLVAVSLLHRAGYFFQRLDASGWQTEQPAQWVVDDYLREMPARATVTITAIAVWAKSPSVPAWLKQHLALPHGIPTKDTDRRVLQRLRPEAFPRCFES